LLATGSIAGNVRCGYRARKFASRRLARGEQMDFFDAAAIADGNRAT